VEFLLCGMEFPNKPEFLLDPNVWIANTGAMVHNTPHLIGMKNVRMVNDADAVTMGSGKQERAAKIGDISSVMCNKNGDTLS